MGWGGGCLIAAVVGVAVLGGLGFFGFRKVMSMGAEEITTQLEDNPVILEHIGAIESVEGETIKSGTVLSEEELENDWWIWSIRGTNGSGILKVRTPEEPDGSVLFKIVEGELRMGDESYDLFPDAATHEKPELPAKPPESLPNPK